MYRKWIRLIELRNRLWILKQIWKFVRVRIGSDMSRLGCWKIIWINNNGKMHNILYSVY